MALPELTGRIDLATNQVVVATLGTWDTLGNTWSQWGTWSYSPDSYLTWHNGILDLGRVRKFNVKTEIELVGNVTYEIWTSNTATFDDHTVTNVSPNTSNISAFWSQYAIVVANVTNATGTPVISTFNAVATTDSFDIEINDVDSASLEPCGLEPDCKIIPLPRTVGAVLNMQITAHNPTVASATYVPQANDATGYVVTYNGPSTTLSNTITTSGNTVEYLAMATDGLFGNVALPGLKLYKTTNGVSWSAIAAPANVAAGGTTVAWSPDGTTLAAGFAGNAAASFRWYSRSGDTLTKLSDPDEWASTVRRLSWSPEGDYIAVGQDYSPFLVLYSRSSNNLSKAANPATLPTGVAYDPVWSPNGTYLAVAHGGSPYVTIYKRSGNTFTKLANPAVLPGTGLGAGTAAAWDPTSTYLAVAVDDSTNVRIVFYYRVGDTFNFVTGANIVVGTSGSGSVSSINWNPTGTHLAVGQLTQAQQSWSVYNQSGNTFVNSNVSVTSLFGRTTDVEFSSDSNTLFATTAPSGVNNPRGISIYDVSYSGAGNATVTVTALTGVTSNVGNVVAVSALTTSYSDYIEVANAAIFSSSGGNIRINNESLSYATANTSVNPNRLEQVTRGVTTTQFGVSTANLHLAGSEVFPIDSINFDVRYFETQAIGIAVPYVGRKEPAPTLILRDASGAPTNTVFDARLSVLPEQFMDDRNLGTR
jgi:hypothetical protein